ncbi:type I restriction endonuclease subunit R [Candidatus Thioglobus autotrophicus]|uniref:type I restriction endonuclease subunit R n=1 Tax=Candidatus Thioglobus autotrophicus TaxID=1705394 RepID=UPI00299E88EE|nr:type I restriction endonuclease subunit R [Candidatus Thioglobus autotrophicus]WPE18693.1 type I restriction endonuclease subunit R [Candidatus Thioglobus autotrophicus]
MATQSEQALENLLIKQLESLEYERVAVVSENDLLANLKRQLEKHNKTTFSEIEFKRITNHLNKGNVFDKAKILRDKFVLTLDNGETKYIEFLDSEHWCQNLFQVTNQVTIEGNYKNRYDVTILINGLPLVQIELKKRGVELKQAFNQINRYQKHSFQSNSALFGYVQVFVISNGVNTKYYANNKKQSFKQTFFWADKKNQNITNLEAFTDDFLERCHISKMICKYIVLAEVDKILMVLRPYQYYAAEAIIDRVTNSDKNGYIWHTTGSGKTLTSFKASQILMKLPQVHKVVFVVDRKDLDFQTTKEFNSFSDGSVDGTDNTKALVKQFSDDTKLIVTTIQKLNTAISKSRYQESMEGVKDKHIVFIFDECHRSQFGETHLRITNFFENNQMIGFTGTPIFAQNAVGNKMGKRTTVELFDDCLHKYVITDAIKDDNVLKFSIEYVGRYKEKKDSANNVDIEVENIDIKELLESNDRLNKITDYIIDNHARKTHSGEFNAMFAVSGIPTLTKYYDLFKSKREAGEHKLKVATIFSYSANEDDQNADGVYESDGANVDDAHINQHSRDKLESYIQDYNQIFNTKFTTKDSQSYYNYYNDISKRVKSREIDILLVVNMFLTGFDSKMLNTLYVDKNLKYHGLIQAFSRTNRIVNEKKSQGNIVCFRNLKEQTDEAIALFSNKEAKDVILMKPYEEYVELFNKAFMALISIAPSVSSVDGLINEDDQLEFIKAFRELMRLKNVLTGFSDFNFADLSMGEQQFEDYKSKYLDLYEKVKSNTEVEKVSILDEVDFELELIHKDEINVAYILRLLAQYRETDTAKHAEYKKSIINIIAGQEHLRSKRELIEEFIDSHLMGIAVDDIDDEFEKFWEEQKVGEFGTLCKDEGLVEEEVRAVVETYLYDQRKPLADDIAKTLQSKPKLLERKKIIPRVLDKIMEHIEKFYEL